MATSSSYDFSQNRDALIKDAMVTAQIEDVYDTPEAEYNTFAANELNRMLKGWMADGLHLWSIRPAYLFLEKNKREYLLGATDHFTETFVQTDIRVAGVATDTTIEVDSTTGMTAADICLIQLDDGTLHETTINTVTDGDTLVIDNALPSAVAVDKKVFTYTSRATRPIRVQQAIYHETSSSNDTRMYQIAREDFWNLANKGTDSQPTQWYFDPQLTTSKFRIYGEPNDVGDYITMVCHFPFDDMDAAANDFGFPQEWLDAIHWNLAYRVSMQFGSPKDVVANCARMAFETKTRAMGWDEERANLELRPDAQWLNW